ncbi:MAG: hypothetical protein JO046_10975, partial [Solirubrobacterales bacterium]|nr:hypothetical protein [Solirubrobacterales bacterium]
VSVVEHPHFTPERIRRFVAERLDELRGAGDGGGERRVLRIVEDELGRPTEAMRNSFRSLEHEHRDLLIALADVPGGELEPVPRSEAESLTRYVLGATRRAWQKQARPLPVFLVEAWYAANAALRQGEEAPPVARTWTELHPSRLLLAADLSATDLQALDDWLALAQVLSIHDRELLRRLGFYERDQQFLHTSRSSSARSPIASCARSRRACSDASARFRPCTAIWSAPL